MLIGVEYIKYFYRFIGAQSPPMMTSPHGYSEALKRNLQVLDLLLYTSIIA